MDKLTRSGDFSEGSEVAVEHGTEIGELAELFNKMITRVRDALEESSRQKSLAEALLQDSELQKQKVIAAQQALKNQEDDASVKRAEFIHETQKKVSSVTDGIDGVRDLMTRTSGISRDMVDSFRELVGTLQIMLDNTGSIHEQLIQMDRITRSSTESTNTSRLTISDLKNITGEIAGMVTLINDIADKTHILSINSGIEAARSGEAGKGFVVISKEIRELSEKTSKTAAHIGIKLNDVNSSVEAATDSLGKVIGIIGDIEELNNRIGEIVSESRSISGSLRTQSEETISAVENVSGDIERVVDEAGHLSNIGKQVAEELSEIK